MIKNNHYTDVHFSDDTAQSIVRLKNEIRQILLNLKLGKSVISYNGQILTAMPCDFPRLLTEWNKSDDVDHALRNILLSAFLSAEEKCTGSALICAGIWSSNIITSKNVIRNSKLTEASLKSCLDYMGGSGLSRATANAAIKLGAIGHKVEYQETDYHTTKVEAFVGKDIIGNVEQLFGNKVTHKFDLESCIICAIDGTVESVASIDKILTESKDKNIIILANNFLPDVSNSMAETWLQKKGKCIPFKVSSWNVQNFLNLENMGICCASPDRGDLISSISLESSKTLNIHIDHDRITIQSENDLDRTKITIMVSKSLGGLVGTVKDRIKTLIGYARISARSGVITWELLQEESKNLSELYSKDLVMPLSSWVNGQKASESLQNILQSIGCLIIVKKGVLT